FALPPPACCTSTRPGVTRRMSWTLAIGRSSKSRARTENDDAALIGRLAFTTVSDGGAGGGGARGGGGGGGGCNCGGAGASASGAGLASATPASGADASSSCAAAVAAAAQSVHRIVAS